jgi:hypothetical protein
MNVAMDIDQLATELQVCEDESGFRQRVFPKIKTEFNCSAIEVWKYDENASKIGRYLERGYEQLPKENQGIAWSAIESGAVVNVVSSRAWPAYLPSVDGIQDEAVLAAPVKLA